MFFSCVWSSLIRDGLFICSLKGLDKIIYKPIWAWCLVGGWVWGRLEQWLNFLKGCWFTHVSYPSLSQFKFFYISEKNPSHLTLKFRGINLLLISQTMISFSFLIYFCVFSLLFLTSLIYFISLFSMYWLLVLVTALQGESPVDSILSDQVGPYLGFHLSSPGCGMNPRHR